MPPDKIVIFVSLSTLNNILSLLWLYCKPPLVLSAGAVLSAKIKEPVKLPSVAIVIPLTAPKPPTTKLFAFAQ